MVAVIASFLTDLPRNWKAASALIGAVGVGFSAAMTMLGAQVGQNTDNITVVRDSVAVLGVEQRTANEKLDRAICLIELTLEDVELDPVSVGRRCP